MSARLDDRFAVLLLPGRVYRVIERRTDNFKNEVYVVVAEADEFEARKIAAALNKAEVTR